MSLLERIHGWRDRLLGSPRFHRWAARFPPTRPIVRRNARALFDLCAGYVYSQVLLACVELRLFELLRERPLSAADLSAHLSLPRDSAERLLAAAVSLNLLERREGGRFGLGPLGAASLGNPGIAAMVTHGSVLYRDLADPVALLRRGRGETELAGFWPYATGLATDAGSIAPYTRLMAASLPLVAEQVLDAYSFRFNRSLLDIGGGDGSFLSAVARQSPAIRLALIDLPPVADLARARFEREGLGGRAIAIAGDILSDPLPPGHDVVSLIRVIHDHDDGPALAILRAAWAALAPGGTLVLAEPMSDAAGAGPVGDAYFSFYLMTMGSGRPRSAETLEGLLRQAGFVRIRRCPTPVPLMTGVLLARKGRQA